MPIAVKGTGMRPISRYSLTKGQELMATATTINRDWIAAEFSKGIEAEQALMEEARARAESST